MTASAAAARPAQGMSPRAAGSPGSSRRWAMSRVGPTAAMSSRLRSSASTRRCRRSGSSRAQARPWPCATTTTMSALAARRASRLGSRMPRWCSSATASRRRNTSGMTSRARTSRARSCSCSTTTRTGTRHCSRARRACTTAAGTTSTRARPARVRPPRSSSTRRRRRGIRSRSCRRPGRARSSSCPPAMSRASRCRPGSPRPRRRRWWAWPARTWRSWWRRRARATSSRCTWG